MPDRSIYLDNHATTRLDPRALASMMPFLEGEYGNPSSRSHPYGWRAEEAVEEARVRVASLVGAQAHEIFFTSGATESNNIAIKGFGAGRVVSSPIEHKSVLAPVRWIEARGLASVQWMRVGSDGIVPGVPADYGKPALVSAMLANNEVGTIQPLADISSSASGAVVHSDIAQAIGKIPVDLPSLGVGLASLSAHKMYGPKGIGALYVREDLQDRVPALVHGGGQEQGIRSGTLNVPAIVGFGEASKIVLAELAEESRRIGNLRDLLASLLADRIPNMRIHGGEPKLPGNLCVSLPCRDMTAFMAFLSSRVAISSGSACMSSGAERSHVLAAMGIPKEEILRSVRFGLGRFTTEEEIRLAVDHIAQALDMAGAEG